MSKYLRNKVAIAVFSLPALIIYTVLVFYPFVQGFYKSFFEWDGLSEAKFIWFDNFARLFQDELFYTSLKNGLLFGLVLVIFQVGFATFLALAISNQKVFGRKFLRTAYFIPVVLSVTVACQLWLAVYNPDYGLINKILASLGISYQQNWLNSSSVAIIATAFVNCWQFLGYQFALIYAGIKSIPEHFFEAARIDGASSVKAHIHVTIPLLAETFKVCLIIAFTGGLTSFAHMLIMTNGGPGTTTYSLTFMVFRMAFERSEFGYGCAAGVILVLECFIATMVINRFIARERITY